MKDTNKEHYYSQLELPEALRKHNKSIGMHSVDIVSRDDGQSGSPSATFPQKLFSMLLLNIDQGEIIHWLPHGLAFKVVDNEKFSEGVLPKYFKREYSRYFQTRKSVI